MKIAIVGTSKLTMGEADSVSTYIETIVKRLEEGDMIITGDATGVDHVVRLYTPKDKLIVKKAETKSWNGEKGFKARNTKIAQMSDKVISISTKIKEKRCHHCPIPNHERTGGCWTMKHGLKLGKEIELIIV